MNRPQLKRMDFRTVKLACVVMAVFIMCYITLMMTDAREERNARVKALKEQQEMNNLVSHLFASMKHKLHEFSSDSRFKSCNNTQTIHQNLESLNTRANRQKNLSSNWTEMIKQWQNSIKHKRHYRYLINNENLCEGLIDQKIVILIYSAISNFVKRTSLRNTWADFRLSKRKRYSVVFLLGEAKTKSEQDLVSAESSKYGDIIQGDFIDDYYNLTHKGLLGFQWTMDFCQNARLLLKVDDDVFVDIFKILDNYNDVSYDTNYLGCQIREIGNSPILRDGKWKLDEKYFPGQTFFPFRHCNGYFVMMSLDVMSKIYELAESEPKIWIDDVYLFGLLLDKIDSLNLTQLTNSLTLYEDHSINCFGDIRECPLISGYTYNQGFVEKLWKLSLLNSYKVLEKYGNVGYIFVKSLIKLSK